MIDMDMFKEVNDTYGHTSGDTVLKDLANIIKSNIRKADLAFRYGGDEFMILCPQTSVEDAKEIAENIRKTFSSKTYWFNDEKNQFHISVGIAECKYGEYETAADIIRKADQALYEAKEGGRNAIVLHE